MAGEPRAFNARKKPRAAEGKAWPPRRFISGCLIVAGVTGCLPALPGLAQDASPRIAASAAEGKVLLLLRTGTPPTLDGRLDDAAWSGATTTQDMHQYEPVDHGEPSEPTTVYLAYDDENLYVAARMWDSEPDRIVALQMVQNRNLRWDDSLAIYLDPFNNKRTGYRFQVNPNGSRDDAVFETPTNVNADWDGIWHAEARIDEAGWVAEFAIPFKTLNFDPDNPDWGFSIERSIARKQEEIAWVSYNRQVNPGTTGVISGLTGLRQGKGLDIAPAVVLTQSRDFEMDASGVDTEPSLELFYNFTPSLTGALTINTDFSATEVDDRRINLTRFSLFLPEKRDFFLRDVDIFSFGGLERNGIPFFSRRIGLSDDGRPVDLEVGAKLTGRVGRWNFGALNIRQDAYRGVDATNLFVGRAAANILEESSIGMIVTDGNPRGNLDNSLVGVDFRYRNTALPSGKTLEGGLWYQRSDSEGVNSDQDAWGWSIASPNSEGFAGWLGYDVFENNFNPALGFVNRENVRRGLLAIGYYNRLDHPMLRELSHFVLANDFHKLSGGLESRSLYLRPLGLTTHAGDEFAIELTRDREVLLEDFEISDGVVIPPGDYAFDAYGFEVTGASIRAIAPRFEAEAGEFFGGDIVTVSTGVGWRPNRHMSLQLNYEYNDVRLPYGDFTARLVRIDADYAFNARWSWLNLLQYDNNSDSAGINSRLRWNPRAGKDLYIVVNHGFAAQRGFSGLRSTQSQLAVKYTQTLRL